VIWDILRARAGGQASGLYVPLPAGPGCCVICRGPTRPGYLRCFQCATHWRTAPGLLADIVVPVSYAVAGGTFARSLWLYKSEADGWEAARAALRLLLLVFLHDHGKCVWQAVGTLAPSHVAVVPSGQGRPGAHPLRKLVEPYLALEWVSLLTRPGDPVLPRDLHPGRFEAAGRLAGASVLLLDDTWTSGASAQSAAAALKLAGASRVAVVTLGRHVNLSDPSAELLAGALTGRPFRLDLCALHGGCGRPQHRGTWGVVRSLTSGR
jgi:hypothetical protein